METDLTVSVDREGPVLSHEHMFLERYVIEDLVA
jgi:hypothetical protein